MPSMVFRTVLSSFYDGSTESADDCLLAVQAISLGNVWSIHSNNGTTLVLRETQGVNFADWPVSLNTWLVVAADFGVIARINDATYQSDYRTPDEVLDILNVPTELAADTSFVEALIATPEMQAALAEAGSAAGGFGLASVPSLILNQSTTVQVAISPAFPDTSYTAAAFISGAANLLASLSITGVSIVSGSRVDVTVKNTGLVTLAGALVMVHAAV